MLKIKGLYLPMLADRIICGNVFFLGNSITGALDVPGNGKDPERPFATLDYALSKCTADNDDYIIVLPGHSETFTAVQTVDVSGVHVIGVQAGARTPKFTGNAAADCISITAASVEFNGFQFGAPITDAQTANINIAAANVTVKNIYMPECSASSSVNIVDVITVPASSNDLLLENITIFNSVTAVNSFLSFEGASSNVTVKNFRAFGDVVTGGIIDGAKITYLWLENVIVAVVGTAKPAVTLDSNPEGIAIGCKWAGTVTTLATNCALGNLMRIFENRVTEETDGSVQGAIIPAADTD